MKKYDNSTNENAYAIAVPALAAVILGAAACLLKIFAADTEPAVRKRGRGYSAVYVSEEEKGRRYMPVLCLLFAVIGWFLGDLTRALRKESAVVTERS